MNIVHIVPGRPKPETANGVLQSVYYLSIHQGVYGHKVDILSLRGKIKEESIQIASNVNVHFFERYKLRFFIDKYVTKYLEDHADSIDIVHFHSAYHPEYWTISRILKKLNISYVISPRGSYQKIANKRNFILKKIYKALFEISIIKNAEKIHALNNYEAVNMHEYGVPNSQIVIIPNGVDIEKINNIKQNISKAYSDEFVLVYCGRIDAYYKGLDVLVRAMKTLTNRGLKTKIHLRLVGPDWKNGKKDIEKLVNELSLQQNVTFYGAKYGLEKYELYSTSAAFILPSRTEGMPTSVLDAMAFGLPCILTPETNIDPKIMENGGCIFVKLSTESLADTIEKAMSDKHALQLIGLKGQEWVKKHYNYPEVASQHISVYKNLSAIRAL